MKIVDNRNKNTTELCDLSEGDVIEHPDFGGFWIVTDDFDVNCDERLIVCLEDGATLWSAEETEVAVVTNAKIVIGSEKESAGSQTNRIDIFGDDVDDGSDKSGCGDCGACGDRCSPAKEMVINDTIVKLGKKKDKKK